MEDKHIKVFHSNERIFFASFVFLFFTGLLLLAAKRYHLIQENETPANIMKIVIMLINMAAITYQRIFSNYKIRNFMNSDNLTKLKTFNFLTIYRIIVYFILGVINGTFVWATGSYMIIVIYVLVTLLMLAYRPTALFFEKEFKVKDKSFINELLRS